MFVVRRSVARACATRAFSTTASRLAISPYAKFVCNVYSNKAKRAILLKNPRAAFKTVAKWYKALSTEEKYKLKYEARNTKSFKRTSKRLTRKASAYNKHIKTAMKSKQLAHLPAVLRFKAAAKLWK